MTQAERIKVALSHLRLIEWDSHVWGPGVCPFCSNARPNGHTDDCDLGQAITALTVKTPHPEHRHSLCYS